MSFKETLSDYFVERKQRGRPGLPIYSVTIEKGLVPRDALARRMESALHAEAHALVEPGDVAYNMMRMWQGALGVCREPCIVSPAYVVMQPKPSVDPAFASAWMKSERGLNLLWSYSHGITDDRLRLYPDDFLAIPVSFPPLQEQRRIASVLATWNDAVAAAERLVTAKRRQFDWLCESALTGRVRLPGFAHKWQHIRLAEVLHEHGATSTGVEPVYSVSVRLGLVDQIQHLGRSFAAVNTSNYNRVKSGDVVYTKSPTGQFPLGIVKQSRVEQDVIVSPLYGVFTPQSDAIGILLDAFFSSPAHALRFLTPLVQKGAKNTIAVSNGQFLEGSVNLPTDKREAQALAEVIKAALNEIEVLDRKLELLRRQGRGLSQKLLTRELRVPSRGDALIPGGLITEHITEAAE